MRESSLFLALSVVLTAACASHQPATGGVEDGTINTNGTSLHFKTMGEGDPIVVLHGGPGFDHRQFLPFIWELASDHKVILYDQRGTGLSSGPVDSSSITIENFIEDLDGIREAFGIEQMNLLGHSWGGILAMHYAVRHPERLKSLILCSTTASVEAFDAMQEGKMRNWGPEDIEGFEAIAATEAFQNNDPEAIAEFWRVYFRAYFVDPAFSDSMDLTFTENTILYSNAVAGYVLNSVGAFDLHEELRGVDVPSLVFHGDSDPMPVSYAERIHEALQNSELVVAENSGHWPFIDATEEFRSSIVSFLGRIGSS